MRIQESGEMYLETILRLSQKSGHVRAIDVSEEMGYSKPSVSRAMSLLNTHRCGARDCRKDLRTPHAPDKLSCFPWCG